MNIEDIVGKKIAVHCKTEAQARRFVKMAYENGYMWTGGNPDDTHYHAFGKDTCYYLDKAKNNDNCTNLLTFSNMSWSKKHCCKIIPFSEIASEKVCFNVEIKRKKRKTIATLKNEYGKYIRHVIVECASSDTYDFEIGKKIALQRLFQIENKDCSSSSDREVFLESIDSHSLYGKVGEPTNLQAYGRIPLFVGDVAELIDRDGKGWGIHSIGKDSVNSEGFVMSTSNGVAFVCFKSKQGLLIIKRKSFGEMKDGDIVDGVKYVERRN